jgi:hypothetical protein
MVKISEYPVIDYTLVNGTFEIEYFTPVAKFRWLSKANSVGNSPAVRFDNPILQQLHQGSGGTEEWVDVETVFEEVKK